VTHGKETTLIPLRMRVVYFVHSGQNIFARLMTGRMRDANFVIRMAVNHFPCNAFLLRHKKRFGSERNLPNNMAIRDTGGTTWRSSFPSNRKLNRPSTLGHSKVAVP